jgi:hypothetical protein
MPVRPRCNLRFPRGPRLTSRESRREKARVSLLQVMRSSEAGEKIPTGDACDSQPVAQSNRLTLDADANSCWLGPVLTVRGERWSCIRLPAVSQDAVTDPAHSSGSMRFLHRAAVRAALAAIVKHTNLDSASIRASEAVLNVGSWRVLIPSHPRGKRWFGRSHDI